MVHQATSSSSTTAAAPLLPLHQQSRRRPRPCVPVAATGIPVDIEQPRRRSSSRRRIRRSSSSPLNASASSHGSSSSTIAVSRSSSSSSSSRASTKSFRASKQQSQPSQSSSPPTPSPRLHSGSAVAGFVVGTTFEACLIGLLSFLHLRGDIPTSDPLLCHAILSLAVVGGWSVLFSVVLQQLDALCPTHKLSPDSNLYGHFNMGLAGGMGLECTLLQYLFAQRTVLTRLLLSQTVGIVSLIFGVGCVGMTVLRTYYYQSKLMATTTTTQQQQSQQPQHYQRLMDHGGATTAGMV